MPQPKTVKASDHKIVSSNVRHKRSFGTNENGVVTAANRDKSVIATSPAAAKAYLDRSGSPLILDADVKMSWSGVMSVKDLMSLQVDTRYQREEISSEVNMLIHVLNHHGQIPDPVSVAERPDGSRWIVDGQQRWWAHVDTGTPMQARIFKVRTYEQELTLFHVLNNSKRLTGRTRVRSWPRQAGAAIIWADTAEDSPLRGLLSFTAGHAAFPAVTVLRGMQTVASGALGKGAVESVCAAYDRAYEKDKAWVDKATKTFVSVIASIFEHDNGLRHLVSLAFGRVCHATWRPLGVADAWPTPTPRQIARFKKMDWDKLAPGHAQRWLPVMVSAIKSVWTEAADPDEYARSVRGGKKAGA